MSCKTRTTEAKASLVSRWSDRHKWLVYLAFIILVLVMIFLPLLTVTIQPGQGGVYYNRLLGGTDRTHTYGEGIHLVLPWNRMYVYNLRLQEISVQVNALSLGGLRTDLDISIIFWPVPDDLPELHVKLGEDYAEKLIVPTVVSTARSVMTYYDPGALYGAAPNWNPEMSTKLLQGKIFDAVQETLIAKHIHVESILVKKITLPDFVKEAINKKYMAEQDYLRYKYTLAKSREALKVGYIQAETARLSAEVLSQSLSPAYLRYLGILATRELATSANAKVVLVGGGEDGLPLILNLGDAAINQGEAAAGQTAPPNATDPIKPAVPDLNLELSDINDFNRIGPLLNELNEQMPPPQDLEGLMHFFTDSHTPPTQ